MATAENNPELFYGFPGSLPEDESEIDYDQLLLDTFNTEVRTRYVQARYNRYGIYRHGQAIGEAVLKGETPAPDDNFRVRRASIESIDTDPSNDHSVLLAVIREAIASYPELDTLKGVDGLRMARIAPGLMDDLPEGWEYESRNVEEDGVVSVGHLFRKTDPV